MLSRSLTHEPGKDNLPSTQFHANLKPGLTVSQFLKNTSEQIKRFHDKKKYAPKLLAVRAAMNDRGFLRCTFLMFNTLSIRISNPVTGVDCIAVVRESDNHLVIVCPSLSYTVLFEECHTGIDFVNRLLKGGFLSFKTVSKEIDSAHGGVSL